MKIFEKTATISAPAEKIWGLLTDAGAYPAWNTAVDKVEGQITSGAKMKMFAKVSPGRPFPVTVSEFVPNQKMVWSNAMPLGLFSGVRTFTLTPKGGAVEFTMREVFSGPLSFMIEKAIPDLTPHFEDFVGSLKKRAEA
jgi:hypothetical protein